MGQLLGLAQPAAGIDHHPPAGLLRPRPLRRRQCGEELSEGASQRNLQAEVGGGRTAAAEEEEGTGLHRRETADIGAVARQECDAPMPAPLGVDGHPGGAQRLDVAMDCALGHLQPLGQLPRAQPPMALEQEQQGEEAVGLHDPKAG